MDDTSGSSSSTCPPPRHRRTARPSEALYQAPRTFVTGRMKSLRTPVFSGPLTALPTGYQIPATLSGKVFYDAHRRRPALPYVPVRGRPRLADRGRPRNDKVAAAVAALASAQEAGPEPGNTFLTSGDLVVLFAKDIVPADRFHFVLERLTPY